MAAWVEVFGEQPLRSITSEAIEAQLDTFARPKYAASRKEHVVDFRVTPYVCQGMTVFGDPAGTRSRCHSCPANDLNTATKFSRLQVPSFVVGVGAMLLDTTSPVPGIRNRLPPLRADP